MTEIESKHFEF